MASPADTEKPDQLKTGASSTSDTDQENTDSSNPSSSEKEPSTFDVVMSAINKEGDDKDEASSEDDKSKAPKGDKKPEDAKDGSESDDEFEDFTPEERKHLKKATTERFDKLKNLYRTTKDELIAVKSQIEEANVEAGYYRKFVGFLDENRISQDEANQLFHIGAMMKNDPVGALNAITPYYTELLRITGNVLPPDLQQQVQQGYITKDRALELSRLRATGETEKQIRTERENHQQQRETTRQRQQEIGSIQSAVANWERQWASSDADYAKKKERVLDRVELLLTRASKNGSLPKTVDEAVKLANQAKSEVEADLRRLVPQRKQVIPVDGGSSASNMPDAQNTADVIRRTLNH